MNEYDDSDVVIIPLEAAGLQWLHRALQWPEDIVAYDQLNTPINGAELGMLF